MELQGSLLEVGEPTALEPYARQVERIRLSRGAWLDLRPGWLLGGDLFDTMLHDVPWHAERRQMYDREVAVPRLLAFYDERAALPHPMIAAARDALSEHYLPELGEPFATAGCCLYRDGGDSVAWHGDRVGRGNTQDTMVAICSLGSDRKLLLRPRGGGVAARSVVLGHGDVAVMGGSCQRTWEHAIPKTTRPVGPRISIQFRVRGVR